MNYQFLSRDFICADADRAAQRYVAHQVPQSNPHEPGTEAHAIWKAAFERSLLKWSAPDAEGGA